MSTHMHSPSEMLELGEKYGLSGEQVIQVCFARLKEGDPFAKIGKVFLVLYGAEFQEAFQKRMALLHPGEDDLFGYQLCVAVSNITGLDLVKGGGQ